MPPRHWSSKPLLWRSSIPLAATCRRSSTQCLRRRCGCAKQPLAPCILTTVTRCVRCDTWSAARFAEYVSDPANQPGPEAVTPRLMRGASVVHVSDLMQEDAYQLGDPYRRALVDIGGARTLLAVPLPREGSALGQIVIYRQDVRPYTEKQIARSPIRDLFEGFSHFVTSMTAPIASGWSESPGGACTHWKTPPLHGAHRQPTLRRPLLSFRPTRSRH